jgi:hypothetical protein
MTKEKWPSENAQSDAQPSGLAGFRIATSSPGIERDALLNSFSDLVNARASAR